MFDVDPVHICKGVRPLFWKDGALYCSKYNQLLATRDFGQTFERLGQFPVSSILRLPAACSSLFRRVGRMAVYRLRVLDNGDIVFVFRGGIYRLAAGRKEAILTFPIVKGSRPVSLAYKPGGSVVWGEYHSNPDRGPINIYGSQNHGKSWDEIYTFEPGEVRHVHGLSYDRFDDCFWICTGDRQDEARLIKASPDFSSIEVVLKGGCLNRFYSMAPTEHSVLVATDSPNAENYLRRVDKQSGAATNVARIQNSSFYNCIVGDWHFCSTNCEGPEPDLPITSPTPNDVNYSHVWMSSITTGVSAKVLSFPADIWFKISNFPKLTSGLFQYTRVFFPEGESPVRDTLVCYAIGVSGADDYMLVYDMASLEEQVKKKLRESQAIASA